MIQEKLNQLIETVSQSTDSEEIFNVKHEYLKKTGESLKSRFFNKNYIFF